MEDLISLQASDGGGGHKRPPTIQLCFEGFSKGLPGPLFPVEVLEQTVAFALLNERLLTIKSMNALGTADLNHYIRVLKEKYWVISYFDRWETALHANGEYRWHCIRYFYLDDEEIDRLKRMFPNWDARICDKAKPLIRQLGKSRSSYWKKWMKFGKRKRPGYPGEIY